MIHLVHLIGIHTLLPRFPRLNLGLPSTSPCGIRTETCRNMLHDRGDTNGRRGGNIVVDRRLVLKCVKRTFQRFPSTACSDSGLNFVQNERVKCAIPPYIVHWKGWHLCRCHYGWNFKRFILRFSDGFVTWWCTSCKTEAPRIQREWRGDLKINPKTLYSYIIIFSKSRNMHLYL